MRKHCRSIYVVPSVDECWEGHHEQKNLFPLLKITLKMVERNKVKLFVLDFINIFLQFHNSMVIKVYFYQLIFFLQKVHLKPPRCTFVLQTFDEIKYDLGHNREKDIESIYLSQP